MLATVQRLVHLEQASIVDIQVAVTIIHPIAILCTSFRLCIRWVRRRLWWDDLVAGLAMLFDIAFLIAIWIRAQSPNYVNGVDTTAKARIICYWIVSLMFTTVLWSARISMLLSTIRLIPPMMTLRRVANAMAVLFILIWVALMAQKSAKCGMHRGWELEQPWLQCRLGRKIAITELATDIAGDLILIVLPLQMLYQARFQANDRRLLLISFSASIINTIVSIPHAIVVMGPEGKLEGLTAHIEAGISLIVANLLTITTFFYRLLKRAGSSANDSLDDSAAVSTSVSIVHRATSNSLSRTTFPNSFDMKFLRSMRSQTSRPSGTEEGAGPSTLLTPPPYGVEMEDGEEGESRKSGEVCEEEVAELRWGDGEVRVRTAEEQEGIR